MQKDEGLMEVVKRGFHRNLARCEGTMEWMNGFGWGVLVGGEAAPFKEGEGVDGDELNLRKAGEEIKELEIDVKNVV